MQKSVIEQEFEDLPDYFSNSPCPKSFRSLNKIHYPLAMAAKAALECIKQNADIAEKTIIGLKNELETITIQYNNLRAQRLREENAKLILAVEEAKKRLIQLEVKNGVKQIPLRNQSVMTENSVLETPSSTEEPKKTQVKAKEEKKPKEVVKKASQDSEPPIDIGRLDLRIGKVEDVQKHPDADSLYVLKINCGEDKPRTVCSGLVKFVPIDALKNKDVVLLCNLKSAKMRGITSEAMVMCASSPEIVEVLSPPGGCTTGEFVQCDGYVRNPDQVMNPKKKIFETVAPDLATNALLQACYKGVPLQVPGKGFILAATLKNCQVK